MAESTDNMDLQGKISEAIKESLPEKVGQELQEQLRLGEDRKEIINQLEEDINNLENSLIAKNKTISGLEKDVKRLSSLELRKETIEEQEREYKVKSAELNQANAETRVADMKHLLEVVFKSPVYKSEVNRNVNHVQYYDNDGNPIQREIGSDTTEMKSEE